MRMKRMQLFELAAPLDANRYSLRFVFGSWAFGVACIVLSQGSGWRRPQNQVGRVRFQGGSRGRRRSMRQLSLTGLRATTDPAGRVHQVRCENSSKRKKLEKSGSCLAVRTAMPETKTRLSVPYFERACRYEASQTRGALTSMRHFPIHVPNAAVDDPTCRFSVLGSAPDHNGFVGWVQPGDEFFEFASDHSSDSLDHGKTRWP